MSPSSLRRLRAPALALVCALSPAVGTFEETELEKRLRSGDERVRQEAVRELARAGTEEAWQLVLRALEDTEPRVADEDQLRLG